VLDGVGTGALARSSFDPLAFVLVLIRSLLYSMASASVLALELGLVLACFSFGLLAFRAGVGVFVG
jgi:hypothetical protein